MGSVSRTAQVCGVHWSDLGAATAPDTKIMEYAGANNFVVFAHDLDFGRLFALQRGAGPSVVQIRTQDVLPATIGTLVVNALNAARAHLDAGAIVTVDPVRHRIRLLPLRGY